MYQGPVIIKRSMTLVAQKGAQLVGDGVGSVLTIRGKNVTVQGLSIQNGGHDSNNGDALIRVEADGAVIKNNTTSKGFYGIHLVRCHGAQIEGNRIQGDATEEIAHRGNGIQLTYGGDHVLRNNTMSNVQDGIYFDNTVANLVEKNQVDYSRYGYHLMFAKKIRLQQNETKNSVIGSMVMDCEDVLVNDNQFTGQRDTRGYGLFIYETRNCIAQRNILSDNTTGLAVDGAMDTQISGNWISGNAMGIKRSGDVVNTHLTGNALVANVRQLGGNANWTPEVWCYEKRGNYWDDYQGFDLNQDGIGDGAYQMADGMVRLMDQNPVLSIFYAGPIQQLLEWIGEEEKVIDPYPLIKPDKKTNDLGRISK